LPRRPDRPVPGHGQDVHRGRVVPGHVRLRQLGRGRRHVLLVVVGAGVQAAVPARTVRTRRVGGAGPGQGLEDGQVRVPARVHRRAGARRRQQRHRVPAADGHAGQVPKHERRAQS